MQRPAEGGEQAQEGHGRARWDVPAVQQHQRVPGGQQHHDDEDQRGHEARVAPVLSRGRVAVGPGHFEHPVDRCDRRPREDLGLHGAQGLGDRAVQCAVELPLIGRHPAEPSGVRRHRPPEERAEDQRHQQQLRADQGDEDQGHQRSEHHLDEEVAARRHEQTHLDGVADLPRREVARRECAPSPPAAQDPPEERVPGVARDGRRQRLGDDDLQDPEAPGDDDEGEQEQRHAGQRHGGVRPDRDVHRRSGQPRDAGGGDLSEHGDNGVCREPAPAGQQAGPDPPAEPLVGARALRRAHRALPAAASAILRSCPPVAPQSTVRRRRRRRVQVVPARCTAGRHDDGPDAIPAGYFLPLVAPKGAGLTPRRSPKLRFMRTG